MGCPVAQQQGLTGSVRSRLRGGRQSAVRKHPLTGYRTSGSSNAHLVGTPVEGSFEVCVLVVSITLKIFAFLLADHSFEQSHLQTRSGITEQGSSGNSGNSCGHSSGFAFTSRCLEQLLLPAVTLYVKHVIIRTHLQAGLELCSAQPAGVQQSAGSQCWWTSLKAPSLLGSDFGPQFSSSGVLVAGRKQLVAQKGRGCAGCCGDYCSCDGFLQGVLQFCCLWLTASPLHRADLAQESVTAVPLLQTTCIDTVQVMIAHFMLICSVNPTQCVG